MYNDAGEFIESSGKRRVRNYDPSIGAKALPYIAITELIGVDKEIKVVYIETKISVTGIPEILYEATVNDQAAN